MHEVVIQRMPAKDFNEYSLDDFVRHQVVTECWRKVDGEWKLLPIAFTEDWELDKCRKEAVDILQRAEKDLISFIAFQNGQGIGYITVNTRFIGSGKQYLQLEAFQVSEPYRGQGVGKMLFAKACEAAKEAGAQKLYISAHSSKESQAAYRALGCIHALEIIPWIADEEPCDVQMEYIL
ncbi:MAG: GNAT family N-acetyltransferase [Candidatus Gastranaerophilales bacterium]|nr:GNAT family N-acetyltransferase [Candidatus Gastranaerophilales bacterium]